MTRDPGSSYASETRQMVRRERLLGDGSGGPSGYLVLALIAIIVALVVWVTAFR